MYFAKKKYRVIVFYVIAFVLISLSLWGLLELFIKNKDAKLLFIFGEIILIASLIMNKNAFLGELNQSVTLTDDKISCNSFYVAGNLANALIEYNQIKSIQLKRTLFSRHLIIRVNGSENAPIVLNNHFKDYNTLWKTIFDSCINLNPAVYIDFKTYSYLTKISKT